MGTIPAPNIVDSIALGQKAYSDSLTEYDRAAQLKQQNAYLQQQTQAAQLENQAKQRTLADQDAVTKAMGEYNTDKHTPDDIPGLILKNGGSGGASMAAQQHILGLKKTASEAAKDDAETGSKNIDTYLKRHDAAAGELQTHIASDDDASLGKNLATSITSLGQNGYLRPDEVQHGLQLAQLAENDPKAARAQLPAYLNSFKTEKQIFEEAQKTQEQNTKQQEANAKDWKDFPALGVSFNTRTGEQKSVGGGPVMSPEMMASKYVQLQQKQTMKQPLAPEDKAWMRAYEKLKTLVPATQLQMQAGLLTPEAKEMLAQSLSHTGQLPQGMGRSPGMIAGVVNTAAGTQGGAPDLATAKRTFGAQTALQKSATSGDMAKNVTAYNTAIAHAQQLQEAADALSNNDVRALNAIGNKIGYEFGSDKKTNFEVIKNALSGEISKVFKGGEATDAEIKAVQEPFSAANSPAQLKGAITNAIHLMNSKRDALKQQYESGMQGKPNFSGGGGAIFARDPQGKLHQAPAGTALPAGWKLENK